MDSKKPDILILHNEGPDWSAFDKAWGLRMVNKLSEALQAAGYRIHPLKFYDSLAALDEFDPRQWLIWNWGEEMNDITWTDALVAAELEKRGFAFTGASSDTLTRTLSRANIKAMLKAAGLPTLPTVVYTDPAQADGWTNYPAIVKGANQHSSFGIDGDAVVWDRAALAERIAFMRKVYQDDSLIEPFLDTREFHVTVVGNGQPEALPPVEFDYSMFDEARDRMYSSDWKFNPNSRGYNELEFISPAPADDPALQARLQALGGGAYQACGLRDYGRIDLRMLGDEPQILDVNANPDLDETSAILYGAEAAGLSYQQFMTKIAECAAERMPR